jgi:hypothetical protein
LFTFNGAEKMPLTVLNGPVIAAGESLSEGLDLQGGDLVRLTCPAEWTEGAHITFEISTDGSGYNALYMPDGEEVRVVCTPGAAIVVREEHWARAINFLKIRSGTRDNPSPQPEQRDFAVAVEVLAALSASGR